MFLSMVSIALIIGVPSNNPPLPLIIKLIIYGILVSYIAFAIPKASDMHGIIPA